MGDLRNMRWPLVAVSLVLTVALLWAVSWGLRAGTEDGPVGLFLRNHPAVSGFQLEHRGGQRVARLELKAVDDLAETHRSLNDGMTRILGPGRVHLEVADRRTPALQEAFYQINPLIQEALATGRYGVLIRQVEGEARRLGVERARVHIDQSHVYLQLHRGPDYLYAVLQRPDAVPAPADGVGIPVKGWNF